MGIRTKLYDEGRIVEEQMIRLLIKFDERISDLEESGGGSYDDTGIKADISDLKTRVKALEDAQ